METVTLLPGSAAPAEATIQSGFPRLGFQCVENFDVGQIVLGAQYENGVRTKRTQVQQLIPKQGEHTYIAGLAIFEFKPYRLALVLYFGAGENGHHVCSEIYLLPKQVSQFIVAHAREQRYHEEGVMIRIANRQKSSQFSAAVDADFLFLVALESLVDRSSDESLRF